MNSTIPDAKLTELTLHIAQRCATHQLFGKIKLNKILFFADVATYIRTGRSLTGVDYVKREFGPVPERMSERIEQLVADRVAAVEEREMPDGTTQKRVVALRKPDLSIFSAEEIGIVSEVIDWFRPISANDVSELSHRSVGWDVARMGEKIPLATAIIPNEQLPLTAKELQTGARLAKQVERQLGA